MKLVVLGATGGVGLEIVRQAVEHGHSVTAFVRQCQGLGLFSDRITVVRGNLLNSDELTRVIEGHDAVVSGFGPRLPLSKNDSHLLQEFSVALTNAMLRAAINRLIVVSTAFLFKDSILPPTNLVGRLFFPQAVKDAAQMENVVSTSGLEWTLVRPPRLTNKPLTATYRVREGHLPTFGFTISRADVANYMLKAAEMHSAVGRVVGIAN
jgi:putative NADH-flavin reductase